ncbi:MAG: hypothetical protein FJW56_02790 [Actinobacteria bacterium]|nr:hypothetical protein [Actinomycetota bacterium]
MGIKIEKVAVKNLGPIESFSGDFGLFNLIFSKNECGKTFLTEFIIQSLFKNIKRWKFREKGTGKVMVSGLMNEDKIVEFSPGSVKKLEDYWETDEKGLPPSMAHLLVSKGAEPEIENKKEGIGKSLIKEIFSGISLLDKIDKDSNISKTIKQANLDDGNIIIGNTGEGKTYRQLQGELDRIDKLFSEIESKYSKGVIESLGIEERLLREYADKLYKAKCYEACLASENIKDLNNKLKQNDEEELNRLLVSTEKYEGSKGEYIRKISQHKEFQEKCKHYEWLQKALPLYEKLSATSVKKPKIFIAVLSGALAAAAVLFSIFGISIGAIACLAVAAGLVAFYIIKLLSSIKNAGPNKELNNIKKEFKNRTGSDLSDIVTLNLELGNQKESYDVAKLLAKQLEELKNQNESLAFSIQQAFYNLTGRQTHEDEWRPLINAKKLENAGFRSEIEFLQKKLIDFAVRENEYLTENPGISFSYDEYEKIQSRLAHVQEKIAEKKDEIENLKYRVSDETNDDASIDWDKLLENLRERRTEKQNELNFYESKINAGIIVHELITELRDEEDKKVFDGLQSEVVIKSLRDVTKNYCKLSLDGERILVSDNYRDFYLSELSTGAREQVMLALRMGFSSKILNQESLFLILDDSLQHSDWDRRKILVSKLADIALKGWQVIYLTMDDNIRDLFEKYGAKFEKNQYRYIELKG